MSTPNGSGLKRWGGVPTITQLSIAYSFHSNYDYDYLGVNHTQVCSVDGTVTATRVGPYDSTGDTTFKIFTGDVPSGDGGAPPAFRSLFAVVECGAGGGGNMTWSIPFSYTQDGGAPISDTLIVDVGIDLTSAVLTWNLGANASPTPQPASTDSQASAVDPINLGGPAGVSFSNSLAFGSGLPGTVNSYDCAISVTVTPS